jgi:RNA polymerase sigma-70 factor (ECF subfamily)
MPPWLRSFLGIKIPITTFLGIALPCVTIQGQLAPTSSRIPIFQTFSKDFHCDVRTNSQIGPTNLAGWTMSAAQAASDEVLIARIASGDRLAMQVLYGRHHVRVFRFALRLVRNEQIAEDLISEVFLDVWRQAGKFEGRSAVSTWLLAITRFKALSALRKRKDAELDDETAASIEDTSDDPEVAVQKKDTGEALRKCLTALSPEHREIVDLVYYHEKSVEEVADIVGIPENTVKTRLFYARKKLAELLKAAGIERGWP